MEYFDVLYSFLSINILKLHFIQFKYLIFIAIIENNYNNMKKGIKKTVLIDCYAQVERVTGIGPA